ncbi:MAG: hypothetical protein PWQ91_12 [Eubacteriales bacterium]|nr:hypothetical protein [Eubacteriales bacterium]MDN5362951.1 hypothetical protein [Eubacteriales bacterium]
MLNGRPAKAGSEVKPGDRIEIDFGTRKIAVKVLAVRDNVPAAEAHTLYEIVE